MRVNKTVVGVPTKQSCFVPPKGAVLLLVLALVSFPAVLRGQEASSLQLVIPRLAQAPTLEDFLKMGPSAKFAGKMAKVEGFIQKEPSDGQPSTQDTVVYAGYDEKNLYFVFVAFDKDPEKVRATMSRREDIDNSEDWIEVAIDTFNDQRRAYLFDTNPLGLQWDALLSESTGENPQFDEVWYSKGKLTDQGFVVWMKIPFKSLRFPDAVEQVWGIQFQRWQARIPERSLWPRESSKIEGRLSETAQLVGLKNISPGRNVQLIPYGTFRSFRALDTRDPLQPRFVDDKADPDGGLDAKIVFQDSLSLDLTVNPDFNQVESDSPQITANQRFEVFFPEKRPFFLENADLFSTPMNLVFTRRIADPQFGVRLTGKKGPYAIGGIFIDDEAPGKVRLSGDPLAGKRAKFGIVRVSRDFGNQSTIGAIYTDREFEGSYNRVGGVDTRLKFGKNWTWRAQAVTSSTRKLDGTRLAGPAYHTRVERSGRQFTIAGNYWDWGDGFKTDSGFVNRVGFRRITNTGEYQFRPEGKYLINWGPSWFFRRTLARDGTRLDYLLNPGISFNFVGQTRVGLWIEGERERIRPQDFCGVTQNNVDLPDSRWAATFSTSLLPSLTVNSTLRWRPTINCVPPAGEGPSVVNRNSGNLSMVYRPVRPLRISNTYLFTRLRDRQTGVNVFNNHIFRSNWNWQFTQALSVRAILQYDSLIANPDKTRLDTRKNINGDFLLTYLLNPWTALFVGYNSNLQNLDLMPDPLTGNVDIVRNPRRFINDGRQFFVKFSYLIRF